MVVMSFSDATFVFHYQQSHPPALHSAALFGGSYTPAFSEWLASSVHHWWVQSRVHAEVGGACRRHPPASSSGPIVPASTGSETLKIVSFRRYSWDNGYSSRNPGQLEVVTTQ